jgi:ketosteroid isomerase-like protein
MNADKQDLERAATIVACEQLVHRFYQALDAAEFITLAQLFRDDGIWFRQGKKLEGQQVILKAMDERPAGRKTAHLVQNFVLDIESPVKAVAHYLTLVYRHDASEVNPGPTPIGQALAISINHDILLKDKQGWRLVEKKSERRFGA